MKNYFIFFLFFGFAIDVLCAQTPLKRVRVQLNWKPQFEFAAFYVAKEKGYYKEAGLDVAILPGGPDMSGSVASIVARGRAEFGVEYSGVLADVAAGEPLVIMGALFEHSPLQLIVKNAKEKSLYALENFDIYLNANEKGRTALSLLLAESGVKYREHPYDPEAFFVREKAAIDVFVGNALYRRIMESGLALYRVDPSAYGFDFYDDFVIVSRRFWEKNPEVARKFTLATMKGWRYALEHIEEAARILKKSVKIPQDFEALVYEGQNYLTFASPFLETFGLMREVKLQLMLQRFLSFGTIERSVADIVSIVDPLFLYRNGLLDAKERAWVASHTIRCSETDWPPFTIPQSDGTIKGLIPDLLQEVYRKTGLLMRYVPYRRWPDVLDAVRKRELDMAMATGITKERLAYARFSFPYGVFRYGVLWPKEKKESFEEAMRKGLRVAVGRGYTVASILKRYPTLKPVTVDTTKQGIDLLIAGEVDAVADVVPVLKYLLVDEGIATLRIEKPFKEEFSLRAMFRKDYDTAVTVFNKGLSLVKPEVYRTLFNRWQPVEVRSDGVWPMRVMAAMAGVILLLVGLVFWMRGQIVRRRRAEDELKRLVMIDPMTGAYNRRAYNRLIEERIAVAAREGKKIAFAVFDIDHFKRYNDGYGHLAGDDVLRRVVAAVERATRKNDLLFRLGGEEFGLYLEGVQTLEDAEKIAKNIVESVEAMAVVHETNAPYGVVTVSLGLVLCTPSRGGDVNFERIYSLCDRLMYEAKTTGRNRFKAVEVSDCDAI